MSDLRGDPSRGLTHNFTQQTLRRSVAAKKRHERRASIKELFTMKMKFLKQPAGALIAIGLVIAGSAGVYAAANWFNGNVKVVTDESIMTVDLTQCDSNLPPGIEPSTDRSNVKFKITGSPHIEAAELERKLLVNCEFDSVLTFLKQNSPNTNSSMPVVVRSVDQKANKVTVGIKFGGKEFNKTFTVNSDARFFDKAKPTSLEAFKPGDFATIAYNYDFMKHDEATNVFDVVTAIDGMFKTQYDTSEFLEDGKSLYSANNIMPLEQYNQINIK